MENQTTYPVSVEEKAAYFAQYFGQDVFKSFSKQLNAIFCKPTDAENYPDSFLELTPLSAITDEDAYEVGKMVNCWSKSERKQKFFLDDDMKELHVGAGKIFSSAIGKEWGPGMSHPFANNSTDILSAFDFLKSKGYAMNFRNYSVDQLIEMGWLKLKP